VNVSQGAVLLLAVLNVVLILLFPPFDSVSIGRGVNTLDAFYFVFDRQYNKVVNTDLLYMELIWVMLNASIAWLLLRGFDHSKALMTRRTAVLLFAAANLLLVLLFPPFENYASATRLTGTYFDGFHFVFGDKWQRRFYVPLLYIEVLWLLINSSVLWLVLRDAPAEAAPQDSQ
jgi:hypothetical protein